MSLEENIYLEKAHQIGNSLERELKIPNASTIQADALSTIGSLIFAGRFSATKQVETTILSKPEEVTLNATLTEALRNSQNRLSPLAYQGLVRELAVLRAYQLKLHPEIMEIPALSWDYLRKKLILGSAPEAVVTLFPHHRQEFLAVEYGCGEGAIAKLGKEVNDTPHIFLIPGNTYVGQVLAEGRRLFNISESKVAVGSPEVISQAQRLADANVGLGDLAIFHQPGELSRKQVENVARSAHRLLRRGGILVTEGVLNPPSTTYAREVLLQVFDKPSRISLAIDFTLYEIFVK